MIEANVISANLTDKKNESIMHQLLLQHLPKDYLKIERALQKKEWLKLHGANHALLGALLYCDVPQLKLASIELQKALQQNNHSKIIRCAKNLLLEMKNRMAHIE
jgi:HPt (histidine-containing phosphotransfer) domain-containing protein